MNSLFHPKLFTTLSGYSHRQFLADLTAGVIVGIVAIPLAIAFGIASGVTPAQGLITAIVGGLIISTLGGSRVQIGGPTGAFIVIVYAIVQQYGVQGLIIATLLAGAILILMGIARLGTVIEFIPHSVIVGFTSGIALIIFSSQVKEFLGLSTGTLPAEFIEKWKMLIEHLPSVNFYSMGIAGGTVVLMAFWPRISRKVPGSLLAIFISAYLVHALNLPVETVGSRFGELPHALPPLRLPVLDLEIIRRLLKPAFTIAILGAVESLLSAVVADGMIGGRHRPNTELVAQGLANISSSLFGGIPATGAIARTVTNIKNGGRTPVAGIVHAVVILLVLVFCGQWAGMIPLACLAGILTMVAYHMSEWRSFVSILKTGRGAAAVLLTTFGLTVLVDLTMAIEIGMVLALFIFMKRMQETTNIKLLGQDVELDALEERTSVGKLKVPEGVEVYEIQGPFFFAVANKFEEATRIVSKKPKVRVLRLRNVPFIDSTALHALKGFYRKCQHNKIPLIIVGLHVQPLNELVKSELFDLIGEENVFNNIKDALRRADVLSQGPISV
ncbi:MAG TPA: sulfate permease [Candidatus Omnitrophota bacterium]|nr:sulfate permease [Candidatus Omnitrophota bacterium]